LKSLIETLNLGTEYLVRNNIPDARRNMQILMCSVLNFKNIDLYLNFDRPLNEIELSELRGKMKELAKHKPIQYVVNSAQFLSFSLELDNNVLIPRPETEELVKNILKLIPNRDIRINILDIGTGSGCIAISLANSLINSKVFAIDISDKALEIAEKNAKKYNLKNISFYKMDILKQIPKTKFDIIISNPPYVSDIEYNRLDKNVLNYEPKIALTDELDGLTYYRRYSNIFPNMLAENGKFYLEIGYGQEELIKEIFSVTNFTLKVSKDIYGNSRFLEGNYN